MSFDTMQSSAATKYCTDNIVYKPKRKGNRWIKCDYLVGICWWRILLFTVGWRHIVGVWFLMAWICSFFCYFALAGILSSDIFIIIFRFLFEVYTFLKINICITQNKMLSLLQQDISNNKYFINVEYQEYTYVFCIVGLCLIWNNNKK